MPKVAIKVRFGRCIQDSQELGSDEHMVSRVFFEIDVADRTWTGLEVHLKQPVGQSYGAGPLEVSAIRGDYSGPMDHSAFAECVEGYFRSLVGAGGSGIRISDSAHVRMIDNTLVKSAECEFVVASDGGGW